MKRNFILLTLISLLTFNQAHSSITFVVGGATGVATVCCNPAKSPAVVVGSILIGAGLIIAIIGVGSVTAPLSVGDIILITLGTDGSLEQNKLTEMFFNKYPFIEDTQSIDNLSTLVHERFVEQFNPEEKNIIVSVNESEVREIFKSTDLTESELQILIKDLK